MPIDHRRRLNVVSTSVTYSPAARVPTFLSFTFCTYQKLIEKQETKIANKYWRILDMAWE